MTKKEFVELFAKKAELKTKIEAERLTKAFLATLEDVLVSGDEINFIGFGKFSKIKREARTCIVPKSKKEVKVPAKNSVKFKAGKTLLEKVNVKEEKPKKKGKK